MQAVLFYGTAYHAPLKIIVKRKLMTTPDKVPAAGYMLDFLVPAYFYKYNENWKYPEDR